MKWFSFIVVALLFFALHVFGACQFVKGCDKRLKIKALILYECLVAIPMYNVLNILVTRDANGQFFGMLYEKGAVFYDTQHVSYIWNEEDELVNEKTGLRLDPYETYMNPEGEIVLENPETYVPTRNRLVMLTMDGEKRYRMSPCRRDIFGRLSFPESKGFLLGETYIYPVTYEIYINDDYQLTHIQNLLFDEYGLIKPIIILTALFMIFYYKFKRNKEGVYLAERLFITCSLTAFIYILLEWTVKTFAAMSIYVAGVTVIEYLAASFIDGTAREMSETNILKAREGNESELSLAQAMALSTPEGVKSVRRMVIGINVLLTANWLLVIIAVCFNW